MEKIWYLKKAAIFSQLDHEALKYLDKLAKMQQVSKGQTVYSQGDLSHLVFLLKEGQVRIFSTSEEGRELTLAFLEPGDIFGELALAGEEIRAATAIAITDCLICTLEASQFQTFLNSQGHLALKIIKLIGLRRRQIELKLVNLVFRHVLSRIAKALLELGEQFGKYQGGSVELTLRLTHQDIANLVGASRETTSMVLAEMKRQGAISYRRGRLLLLQKELLEDIAGI